MQGSKGNKRLDRGTPENEGGEENRGSLARMRPVGGANGYIAVTQAQDLLANSQPDTTSLIHEHSRHVTYGLQDMNTWLTTAQQDALALLSNPANSAKAQELATLANHALYGVDINGDGKIDYVPGEAGATISYLHEQFMTAMVLSPI